MTEPVASATGLLDSSPTSEPGPQRPWRILALLVVVLMAAGGAAALVASTNDDGGGTHDMAAAAPLELASVSESIAGHYRFAESHQAELSAIPCFCGCEEFLDHRNLYDCFVRADGAGYDSHAAGCGVCIGEAAVAADLLGDGVPAATVAERIVEQFGTTPITSPDDTVPRS